MLKSHPLELAQVESATPAASDLLPLITVTKADLLVGDAVVAKVPPGSLGFEAAQKRDGNRKALQVVPLLDALSPLRKESPTATGARLLIDKATPYRTTLEVFFTTARAGFTTYDFVVAGKSGERSVHIGTPTAADRKAARAGTAPPSLAVVVKPDAIMLSVGAMTIGQGCTKGGTGAAVARPAGQAELDTLVSCTGQLRSMSPEWAAMTTVQLSAADEVDTQEVLSVIAALLPAFPRVYLGLLQ
jgi:hypothetical protein